MDIHENPDLAGPVVGHDDRDRLPRELGGQDRFQSSRPTPTPRAKNNPAPSRNQRMLARSVRGGLSGGCSHTAREQRGGGEKRGEDERDGEEDHGRSFLGSPFGAKAACWAPRGPRFFLPLRS